MAWVEMNTDVPLHIACLRSFEALFVEHGLPVVDAILADDKVVHPDLLATRFQFTIHRLDDVTVYCSHGNPPSLTGLTIGFSSTDPPDGTAAIWEAGVGDPSACTPGEMSFVESSVPGEGASGSSL